MSSYEYEPIAESTPLMPRKESYRQESGNKKSIGSEYETIDSMSANQQGINSFSSSYSCIPNDGNNNSNDRENETPGSDLQDGKIKVYAKRWYILVVFSTLGVLQVTIILK